MLSYEMFMHLVIRHMQDEKTRRDTAIAKEEVDISLLDATREVDIGKSKSYSYNEKFD